jgi:hypothetical protein
VLLRLLSNCRQTLEIAYSHRTERQCGYLLGIHHGQAPLLQVSAFKTWSGSNCQKHMHPGTSRKHQREELLQRMEVFLRGRKIRQFPVAWKADSECQARDASGDFMNCKINRLSHTASIRTAIIQQPRGTKISFRFETTPAAAGGGKGGAREIAEVIGCSD